MKIEVKELKYIERIFIRIEVTKTDIANLLQNDRIFKDTHYEGKQVEIVLEPFKEYNDSTPFSKRT